MFIRAAHNLKDWEMNSSTRREGSRAHSPQSRSLSLEYLYRYSIQARCSANTRERRARIDRRRCDPRARPYQASRGRQGKSGVKPARFPPLCTGDCVARHLYRGSLVFKQNGEGRASRRCMVTRFRIGDVEGRARDASEPEVRKPCLHQETTEATANAPGKGGWLNSKVRAPFKLRHARSFSFKLT